MPAEQDIGALERRLGYHFANPDLLQEALTHPSVGGNTNYQRLEFLGDRVLGVIVAEALFKAFGNVKEGSLARRFASLVKRDTLADVARDVGLDQQLVLGRGADDEGGRHKPAILADVCEAVIGAMYLDGGIAAARQFVEREWRTLLVEEERGARDPKSALQEWAQGRGFAPPVYEELKRTGPDHAPRFVVEVRLANGQSATGEGGSKRKAESAAAKSLLGTVDNN